MKLYQLATAAVITLASIFSNPIESLNNKKLTISSASAQDWRYQEHSWINNSNRIEITEYTSINEMNWVVGSISDLTQWNINISEEDKKAIVEDLEKIESYYLELNDSEQRRLSYGGLCFTYMAHSNWIFEIDNILDKAKNSCKISLIESKNKINYNLSQNNKYYKNDGKFLELEVPKIAHIHVYEKEYNKAVDYFKEVIEIQNRLIQNKQIGIDKTSLDDLYSNIGEIYFTIGDYKQSTHFLRKTIQVIDEKLNYCYKLYESKFNSEEERRNHCKSVYGSKYNLTQLAYSLLRQNNIIESEKALLENLNNYEEDWQRQTKHDFLYDLKGFDFHGHFDADYDFDLFTYGLQELRIKEKRYTDALLFSEYGRTRVLSYLISRHTELYINLDEIKNMAKEQNATLIKYSTPTSLSLDQDYEPKVYIWVVKPTGEVHFANVNLNQKESVSAANIPIIPILILIIGTGLTVYFLRNRKPYLIAGLTLTAIATATTLFIPQNNPVATNVNYNIDGSIADLSHNTFATVRGRNSQEVTENLKEGTCHKDDDCLQQLHKILIDPIAQHLPSNPEEEIVIIPDGELFKVPFAALKNNNNQYLIENHTLRVAPSIQLLKFTAQQQAKQTPKTSQTPLIVGNPEMPRGNNNQRLAALPGTQQEAYAIAELLDTTPLIGERATEWRVKNNIDDADIIHFATHGDPTSLVFASSRSNDGFLRDGEIYGLDLQANLVVLSACETGLGEITSDGIVGISRPFIAAGVPSVVMSLWLVPDAATSELMIDFHKNLQTGQNKAQALRQAMLSTMKTNPEPVNWAGFILVGESDPIQ